MKHSPLIIIFSLFIFTIGSTFAQSQWIIPNTLKNIKNPFAGNTQSTQKGKDLYYIHCHSCHKDPGKNNVLPLQPPPIDIASVKMQSNTDGEIFFKVSEGKGQMPRFNKTLSKNEIWELVAFIRSLKDGTKSTSLTETSSPVPGMFLWLTIDTSTNSVKAELRGLADNYKIIPVEGVELLFLVKRNFGLMELGTGLVTDNNGVASLTIPDDLPGDTNGMFSLIVKVKDEETYGKIEKNKNVFLGKPTIPINIFAKKVLWSWNAHTQLWIILSYLIVVIGIWIGIFYVVYLVGRIKLYS